METDRALGPKLWPLRTALVYTGYLIDAALALGSVHLIRLIGHELRTLVIGSLVCRSAR